MDQANVGAEPPGQAHRDLEKQNKRGKMENYG